MSQEFDDISQKMEQLRNEFKNYGERYRGW